ncbi:unnamed protein product [Oppiella nova]|uniref:Helicase C-terminal domain-containing protein n=1 Tax=Oppiella nova TaxID=334625 RepID=A0A7R9QUB6_9ACAR|nr:unnamed protein product [Oppiella nova]CAG2175931.1 unnamed protein product [Oppiella nova]
MQRITKLPKSKRPAFDDISENSIVYADPMAWVEQLVPENKIEGLGWKVEHTLDSQFNLSATQNLQLSLNESEKKQDWFNVGATIQDMNGNTYNLIDLLGYAIQHNPHLLEDDYIEKMDSDSFLIVHLREAQTQLALRNQEIKPILIYLKEILRHPESATLDQYDAAQFLDLQHHLGMPWRTNERLKIFAEKLQNSYQDQICTPQGFQGELRPYQQQGLAWLQFLRETEHGGILADDMGLDEAQNIKNPRAKASQVVRQIKAKHRLCLTGTPMENHLGELWSLFHFLMPEVAKELPEKTTIEVNIDMNEQQSKLYEAVRATMQKNIRELIAAKGFHRNHLLEMVQDMVEEGRKILIFSQFTTMLQLIEEHLKTLNIRNVKLTGQTKKRDEVITAFQAGDIPVFLISLKAGGVGLNLTAADTVIHYDPWWNPAAEDQASDRAWRIGQDKPGDVLKRYRNVFAKNHLLEKSFDEKNMDDTEVGAVPNHEYHVSSPYQKDQLIRQ